MMPVNREYRLPATHQLGYQDVRVNLACDRRLGGAVVPLTFKRYRAILHP